jgi:hypothetical protein
MKKFKFISYFTFAIAGIVTTALVSCEREFSEDITLATFPTIPEVFTDNPVNLTDEFFISFDPADGANVYGFDTDNDAYKGTQAIKIDVPAPNDPNGGFIGGIFLDRGEGRNLTEYTALTFWARASTTATVGLFGFGTDFIDDKYTVNIEDTTLSTAWKKYIIPIPDPSKLVQEKGMFIFSAGTQSTENLGYSIWLDEIRFEKLNTFAQARSEIFNGVDESRTLYNGDFDVYGASQTVNLGDGSDIDLNISPAYLDYTSSDLTVAKVNGQGVISIIGAGSAKITASIDGIEAIGSITINSKGEFVSAPKPTRDAADVISVFSDTYTDAVDAVFEPGYGGSTTQFNLSSSNGNEFAVYNRNNWTGIEFTDSPIDASAMTHMHVDVFVEDSSTSSVQFQIRDIGTNGRINTNVFTGQPNSDDKDYRFQATGFIPGQWNSFEIPLAGNLTNQRNNLGAIILAGGPNFTLDNIYFYKN